MKMNVIYRRVSRFKRRRVEVFRSYLHAILKLRYERIFRDEGEELALHGIRKRDDEQSEDAHLEDEECEHLSGHCVSSRSWERVDDIVSTGA